MLPLFQKLLPSPMPGRFPPIPGRFPAIPGRFPGTPSGSRPGNVVGRCALLRPGRPPPLTGLFGEFGVGNDGFADGRPARLPLGPPAWPGRVIGRLGSWGRIDPRPGRAVDPPGRSPGEGAGRVIPAPFGSEVGSDGRLTAPRLGRDMPPGRCVTEFAIPPESWGRFAGRCGGIGRLICDVGGRDIGMEGRAIPPVGRDIAGAGRVIPPAGRAIPPDGFAMAGRLPPPPGRASARVARIPRPRTARDSTTAADTRMSNLGEEQKGLRRGDVTSLSAAGATCGRSSSRNPADLYRR